MTIISTALRAYGIWFPLESDNKQTASFPPVTDSIQWFKDVDWADVRRRGHDGLNNVGLVLAVIGEKIHDLGVWLADLWLFTGSV